MKQKLFRVFIILVVFAALFSLLDDIHFNYNYTPQPGFWNKIVERFYFTLVTISTVGYGDITPKTALCRLLVILLILITTFAVIY